MNLITLEQRFFQFLTEGKMRVIRSLRFDVPWLALKIEEASGEQLLVAENDFLPTSSKEMWFQFHNHKKVNYANNLSELEVNSSLELQIGDKSS